MTTNTKDKERLKGVTFQSLIEGKQPVLVDFSAEWCGPCKAMGPILQEVAAELKGKAKIIKVDVDRNPQVAEHFRIMGVPTFILFQNGAIKWRKSGMQSAYHLIDVIEKNTENWNQ